MGCDLRSGLSCTQEVKHCWVGRDYFVAGLCERRHEEERGKEAGEGIRIDF